jgi:glycine dehydrogenase subunit 2
MPALPEISQHQALRHYLRLSQQTMGMDLGSDISEGTCTMKYSPKMHEDSPRPRRDVHRGRTGHHAGLLQIYHEFRSMLCPSRAWTRSRCRAAAAHRLPTPTRAWCACTPAEAAQRDEMIDDLAPL